MSLTPEQLLAVLEALKVTQADVLKAFADAGPEMINLARAHYANGSDDDIEVDDFALTSAGANGIWVSAWVHLPNDVLEAAGVENPEAWEPKAPA